MEIVESRYGVYSRDVVQNLFLLGHIKLSDLAEAYQSKEKPHINGKGGGHAPVNGMNGLANGHISSALDSILIRLLQAGLIETVTGNMFRSPTDTYNKVEKEILQSNFGGSTKGVKQKDELKAMIKDQLQAMRSECPDWTPKGNKRALNGDPVNGFSGTGKRRKLSENGGAANGDQIFKVEDSGLDVGF
jgi:DNA-directed RNA polymerase III subunit RPC3